uniref:PlsC domain-containing protein n=1 Tax=Rhabditophanes sp. KR3021 TaxID=114890 RepID=A0AC35U467_9BILA
MNRISSRDSLNTANPFADYISKFPQNVHKCNIVEPSEVCDTCQLCEGVPKKLSITSITSNINDQFVNVLDFSKFGGVEKLHTLADANSTRTLPSPWFADLRYSINVGLFHSYPSVMKEVLTSEHVKNTIESQLNADESNSKDLKNRVCAFFCEIKASISKFTCRICSYALYKIFRRLMKTMLVKPSEMEKIKQAEESGIPLVYLPLHSSHLDYLILTWLAWHWKISLPHIASGNNLDLGFGFGYLLRATGAFFLRRQINSEDLSGKDVLYRAVIYSYITELLKKRMPIEFFIEGTRCRFGKALLPKNGLISNICDSVNEGSVLDVYIIPVSYTYEQTVEGIFMDELMGKQKQKESVFGVIKNVFEAFKYKKQCGNVRVNFGTPTLLSTYFNAMKNNLQESIELDYPFNLISYRELLPWHDANTPHRNIIRAIGYHVVYDATMQSSISIVCIVSSLLLCKYRNGVRMEELARQFSMLAREVTKKKFDIVGYDPERDDPYRALQEAFIHIEKAVFFENETVHIKDCFVQIKNTHDAFIELAYYKNGIVPVFMIESTIALSYLSLSSNTQMNTIINNALILCTILKYEAIFCKPCQNMRQQVENVYCKMFGVGDGDNYTIDHIKYCANIMRPFLHTLYVSLESIIVSPCIVTNENLFIRQFLQNHTKSSPNQSIYEESLNSDSLYNSIKYMKNKKIISPEFTLINPKLADELMSILKTTLIQTM